MSVDVITHPAPERADRVEDLRRKVAEALETDPDDLALEEDLITRGIDSITMMTIAGDLRRWGIEVKFAELAESPTLGSWQALVSARAGDERAGTSALATAAATLDETGPFDLAPLQLAYWIGRSPGQPLGVGAHFYAELDGHGVQPERLEQAVQALIARHAMLRARFLEDGTQQLTPSSPWPGLRTHNLSACAAEQAQTRLGALREALAHRRLAVDRGELFDVQLSLLPEGATRTHVDIEMLAADAQSFRILLADLAQLYEWPDRELPPIRTSYPRYLAAKRNRGKSGWESARRYWRSRLAELPGAPQLPLAVDPERVRDPRATRRFTWLRGADRVILEQRAREHGVTPSMVFATAFAEVLARWSASPRFLLNLPFYDREPLHPDVERLVGDFTNVLLLAVDAGELRPFAQDVRALQQRLRDDALHAEYTGIEVLRDLAAARPGEQVGAPVVFTSAISLGELFDSGVRRCFGAPAYTMSQTPQVWLDCQVTEREGGLYVNWDAVEELFAQDALDSMFSAFTQLLDWLIAPDSRWSDRPPELLPAEQRRVRARANATDGPVPDRGLHERVLAECGQRGARPAVLWGGGALSHAELGERALALAALLRTRGLAPGGSVAVSLPKGPSQVIAALGVLAAGGSYVPVGLEQPPARRARIAAAAQLRYIICEPELEPPSGVQAITLAEAETTEPLDTPVAVDAQSVAYMIFTSGSTGEPKGVMVPHRAALNTIDAINDRFGVGPDDRALAVSALDFDLSVYDIFGLLDVGGAVVVPEQSERRDPSRWLELVHTHGVTIVNCVPVLLDMLLEAADAPPDAHAADQARALATLRLVLLGGDWVPLGLPGRLHELVAACRFVALGGTTETAIHSTVCEVEDVPEHWRSVPYARPLRNQRMRVVDPRGEDCPDWVPGELWIGGESVARGYHGDPERTARQFVSRDRERWYRTGDQARYWSDGTVEFLGRTDHQIKLRGHRIELGEIEAALESHPDVSRAIATVLGGAGAPPRLAVALAAATGLHEAAVRTFLAERLPSYMIPDRVLCLEALPLSSNGKIDRKEIKLLLEQTEAPAAAKEPARGPVERGLAEAWKELLSLDGVSREDSFFALGGDSLTATRLMTRLRERGIRGAAMRQLFATPVLHEFAERLSLDDSAAVLPAPILHADQEHRHEPFPPTDLQRAYWLGRSTEFTLGGVGSHWYWEFDGPEVDVGRLERAMNTLVARHEMLRAVFDEEGAQRILPHAGAVVVPVVEVAPADADRAVADMREQLAHAVLDPGRWPLFDIRAVRYGARTRVGFGFDYIVLDALSIMIVFAELGRCYADPDTELEPIELSYRDYVLGAAPEPDAVSRSWAHWTERIPDLPPAPQLPLRVDPAQVRSPRFTRRAGRLPAALWRSLVDRGRRHDLTPSTLLATAYAEALSAWSADPALTLNFTLFDRHEVHPDIYKVVGDFTSLMLVAHAPTADGGWMASARALQREVWDGMAHRDVSAVQVIRELARRAQSPEVSMPVVFTSALGVAPGSFDLSAPYGSFTWGLSQTPQVWLDCQVMEHRGELLFNWDAVEALFPEGMLDAMFAYFERLLAWLAAADSDWSERPPDPLPAAQREVRARVNATAGTVPDRGLHEWFFALAPGRGNRPALLWGEDGRLGHRELADRALRVAGALRARGLSIGDAVLIRIPKGPDQVVAALGTLAAGGVYVPVGVEQPAARCEQIQASAGARLALVSDPATLPGLGALTVADASGCEPLARPVPVDPDAPAYVIYTSGSTGEPKGVVVSHRAALGTIEAINDRWAVRGEDRVLGVSALDFDLSVYDIFGLLDRGGAVVLPLEDERREPRRLRELASHHGVTVWNSVPALLDMVLIAAQDDGLPDTLRLVLVSGDWVGLDLPERLLAAVPKARFVALGGATEAAIWSNAIEVDAVGAGWRSIPYGRPLRNQRFRVVGSDGRDRPDWVPGELWIGGAGVALGYRGDPGRTAAQFVTHAGARWYRTGDLGCYWPDGTLEFLGRTDHQVKLRGHRIELGEIEAALSLHPKVTRAVALLAREPTPRLIAFVVADAEASELRGLLARRLPAYMVPEELHHLAELPLTANAKVDRRALARLAERGRSAADHEPPDGPLEQALAEAWIDLLEVERVSRHDNFFALGGDSVLATRLVEELRRRLGVQLTLRQLFASATVATLADTLRSHEPGAWDQPVEEGVI